MHVAKTQKPSFRCRPRFFCSAALRQSVPEAGQCSNDRTDSLSSKEPQDTAEAVEAVQASLHALHRHRDSAEPSGGKDDVEKEAMMGNPDCAMHRATRLHESRETSWRCTVCGAAGD